jgi:hypothetical protein
MDADPLPESERQQVTDLWPLLLVGMMEASGQPSMGLRASGVVHALTWIARAGTSYQSIKVGLVVPPSVDGYGGALEAEHSWDSEGEHVVVRAAVAVSPRLRLEHSRLLHTQVLWNAVDGRTGRVTWGPQLYGEMIALEYRTRHLAARVVAGDGRVSATCTSSW